MFSDMSGIILIFFLILLNAFFATSEIAVLSTRRSKIEQLREEGNKSAQVLIKLIEDPSLFLSTIQIGITLAGFLASAAGAVGLSQILVRFLKEAGLNPSLANTLGVLIITIVISYITLVLGELAPKRIALQWSERIALKVAKPIYFISRVFSPITKFLTFSTNFVVRLIGGNPQQTEKAITEEDIRFYIARHETLPIEEKQMIEGVFLFGDQIVRQVMTPRTEITYLHIEDRIREAFQVMCKTGYSSYPVYRKDYDDIVGIVKIQDLLCHALDDESLSVKEIMVPILFIPETKDTTELLKEFRSQKIGIAVVVDEYGGTSGLVTLEDLVDEIIGEIDPEAKAVHKTKEGEWLVDGGSPIDEVIDTLQLKDLIPDNYETLAGFMLEQLGHIPREGEIFTWEGYDFKVEEMGKRRIRKVLISTNTEELAK